MAEPGEIRIPDTATWQAESLRLTAFIAPHEKVAEPNWWAEVMGAEPDNKTSKPKVGEYGQSGECGAGRLTLNVQPGRVDWVWSSVVDPERWAEAIPTIGPWGETLERFHQLMNRWLPIAPPVQRLALGTSFVIPVETLQEGYRRLSRFLPFRLDAENSSDFLYRINRPRESKAKPGLKLNRLSTWGVVGWLKMMVSVGQAVSSPPQNLACRVETDINTAVECQDIPKDLVPALLQECVTLAGEIAERGDVA
jgi:hypothetical protein